MRSLSTLALAVSVWASEVKADNSYEFGVLVDCTAISGFSTHPVEVSLPPLLVFLLGPQAEDLTFTSGSVGDEINPASGGIINLARNSFGLSFEAEATNFIGFRGTLEVRQPKAYCDLVEQGVVLELNAAGFDIAEVRLVTRATVGLEEGQEAKNKTLDRIGWKYFSSFKRYFSSDYEWVREWLQELKSPFDFETYEYSFGFEVGNRRSYNWSPTVRLNYPAGEVQLLDFLERNEMFLTDFPESKLNFRLSSLGFRIEPYNGNALAIEIFGRDGSRVIFSHGESGVRPQW